MSYRPWLSPPPLGLHEPARDQGSVHGRLDVHHLCGRLQHPFRLPLFRPSGETYSRNHDPRFRLGHRKYLGRILQAAETFKVVGNINEFQVAIGETTFGGREELADPKAVVDYGSLMYLALQRARTAREAILIMGGLVEQYSYYSSGESFSVSDPQEVWILK